MKMASEQSGGSNVVTVAATYDATHISRDGDSKDIIWAD